LFASVRTEGMGPTGLETPCENTEETAFSVCSGPTDGPTAAPADLAAALQVLASLSPQQLGAVLNLSRTIAAE